MTKYYYTCEKDKKLIEKSFDNIANIIFGKNNRDRMKPFEKYWEERVSNVNVFPQGTLTDKLNHTTPGICWYDVEAKKIVIEMLGYSGANNSIFAWIKHEGAHEICHSFAWLLPQFKSNHNIGIVKKNILCENFAGMIRESNPSTGELVEQHYYGKMFNETMTDIISSMSINYFDTTENPKTINDILHYNYNDLGNTKTGYTIFTSLTRLAIAAFSNVPNPDYDSIVKNGYGIFNATTKFKNGETHMVNDFLYGIVFDQLHIEEEFDKYMGDGCYRIFCEYLDRLFLACLKNQQIPSKNVKIVMNILPDFINKKMSYYRKNNIIDFNATNQIVGNFNRIWNSMQKEYGAYFSKNDINDIAKRAGMKIN